MSHDGAVKGFKRCFLSLFPDNVLAYDRRNENWRIEKTQKLWFLLWMKYQTQEGAFESWIFYIKTPYTFISTSDYCNKIKK